MRGSGDARAPLLRTPPQRLEDVAVEVQSGDTELDEWRDHVTIAMLRLGAKLRGRRLVWLRLAMATAECIHLIALVMATAFLRADQLGYSWHHQIWQAGGAYFALLALPAVYVLLALRLRALDRCTLLERVVCTPMLASVEKGQLFVYQRAIKKYFQQPSTRAAFTEISRNSVHAAVVRKYRATLYWTLFVAESAFVLMNMTNLPPGSAGPRVARLFFGASIVVATGQFYVLSYCVHPLDHSRAAPTTGKVFTALDQRDALTNDTKGRIVLTLVDLTSALEMLAVPGLDANLYNMVIVFVVLAVCAGVIQPQLFPRGERSMLAALGGFATDDVPMLFLRLYVLVTAPGSIGVALLAKNVGECGVHACESGAAWCHLNAVHAPVGVCTNGWDLLAKPCRNAKREQKGRAMRAAAQ